MSTNDIMNSPEKFDPGICDSDSDESKWGLEIVIKSTPKKKRLKKEIDPKDKEIIEEFEMDIEESLEKKAAKSNLKPNAVKSILKHVFSNEHVLALVEQNKEAQCQIPYEPKITRSKAKELFPGSVPASIPSPWHKKEPTPEVRALLADELQEESSDDEYIPGDETSEDESSFSGSVSNPATPASSETHNRSLLDDEVFKTPKAKSNKKTRRIIEEENIALRTRSKLSLSQTPLEKIEESFVPPDITTDMYETELNDENWTEFLRSFRKPLEEVAKGNEDEDHDPEYNIFLDEEINKVDKEELRADKAVKVPKKELNELMAELFEYVDIYSKKDTTLNANTENNQDALDSCIGFLDDVTVLSTDIGENTTTCQQEKELNQVDKDVSSLNNAFSDTQKLLLCQQLRQHVQILTQCFILTFRHSFYNESSTVMKEYLLNLKLLSSKAENSIFRCSNLLGALELIDKWTELFENDEPEADETIRHFDDIMEESLDLYSQGKFYYLPFPPLVLKTIADSEVFIYPHLLPQIPFKHPKIEQNVFIPFFHSEYQLLALGLEELIPYCSNLKEFMILNKTERRVNLRMLTELLAHVIMPGRPPHKIYRKLLENKKSDDMSNPVAYFYKNKKSPFIIHRVISLDKFKIVPPRKRSFEFLPKQWRAYIGASQQAQEIEEDVQRNQIEETQKFQRQKTIFIMQESKQEEPPKVLQKILPKPQNDVDKHVDESAKENKKPEFKGNIYYLRKKFTQLFRNNMSYSVYYSLKKYAANYGTILPRRKNRNENISVAEEIQVSSFRDLNMPCLNSPGEVYIAAGQQRTTDGLQLYNNNGCIILRLDNSQTENLIQKQNNVTIIDSTCEVINNEVNHTNKQGGKQTPSTEMKVVQPQDSNLITRLKPPDSAEDQEKRERFGQTYFELLKENLEINDFKKIKGLFPQKHRLRNSIDLYEKLDPILRPQYEDKADMFLSFLSDERAKAIGKLVPFFVINHMEKFRLILQSQYTEVNNLNKLFSDVKKKIGGSLERLEEMVVPLLESNPVLCDRLLQILIQETPLNKLFNSVWETSECKEEPVPSPVHHNEVSINEERVTYDCGSCHEAQEQINQSASNCNQCDLPIVMKELSHQTEEDIKPVPNIHYESDEEFKPSLSEVNLSPSEENNGTKKTSPKNNKPTRQSISRSCKIKINLNSKKVRKTRTTKSRLSKPDTDDSSSTTKCTNKDVENGVKIEESENTENICLQMDEDIEWTREEDKIILETFQKHFHEEAIIQSAKTLKNKSSKQIELRFHILMKLIEEMDQS